ncbi:hypothetical protein KGD83_14145 [Nocardiopsis akebiae]|uniref:Uncharacterized protein n=1 Tax=Nocardiopsis akebiae TaxID=2831968 RepID=A0ABX8CAS5_9ACTN|nr:hypothetical protein [Nocardiopsis akebiae]QUX31517.1 hypothetical protein KGD83_14145 [Nocardiopsis akebiae]
MKPGAPPCARGWEPDEIGGVILQTAVYCGLPAANRPFGTAQEVFARQDG